MKKVLSVLFVVMATISQVRAEGYNCVNSDNNQEHLTINYLLGKPIMVEAILTTLEGNEVFTGINKGDFATQTLQDASGNPAILATSKIVLHRGTCGRCRVDPIETTHYYAKLTINQVEKDFTCSSK